MGIDTDRKRKKGRRGSTKRKAPVSNDPYLHLLVKVIRKK